MSTRLNPYASHPALMQHLIDFGTTVARLGLERRLTDLVKVRASQINGCGQCLHMHTREARKAGESEERLYLLDAWRESPLYSERERAALAWTEALTRLPDGAPSDADYAAVAAQFTEEERVKLTLMVAVINSFNRFGAGFRVEHPTASPAPQAA